MRLLQWNELIFPRAHAELFGVFERFFPFDVRVRVEEVVVMMLPVGFCEVVGELAVRHRLGFEACRRWPGRVRRG